MQKLSPNEINEILEIIRGSGVLGKSERQYKLLEYLLLNTAGQTGDAVSEYSIAVDVFERPENFDREVDSIVRTEMYRLRKNLSEFSERKNEMSVEIPKASYEVIVSKKKRRYSKTNINRYILALGALILVSLAGFYFWGPGQNIAETSGSYKIVPGSSEPQRTKGAVHQPLELALLVDSTISMSNVIEALKDDIKNFDMELRSELGKSDNNIGTIKIKLIFFRDYTIDNYSTWTGRKMPLVRGMERYGPMYESDFFELPYERSKLNEYADYFAAWAGGGFVSKSNEESGLEAIWHAISTADWSSDPNTLRIIALWTDAPPRQLGDITDDTLGHESDDPDSPTWSDATWDRRIGKHFTALSKADREQYMYDNFYPKDVPPTLQDFKASFEKFHNNNAANNSNLETTLFVSIWGTCAARKGCGDWAKVETWNGVKVIRQPSIASDEIYKDIVEQMSYSDDGDQSARK